MIIEHQKENDHSFALHSAYSAPGEGRKIKPAAQLWTATNYCPDPSRKCTGEPLPKRAGSPPWYQQVKRNSRTTSLSSSDSIYFSSMTENTIFHYLLGLKLQCKHNFKQFIIPPNSKYIFIVKSQAPKLRLCYSQKETIIYKSMQEPQAGRDERILYWTLSD